MCKRPECKMLHAGLLLSGALLLLCICCHRMQHCRCMHVENAALPNRLNKHSYS
jgi:hypothetical protein